MSDTIGLWELAVLSTLQERPMHPYEIQRVLKERHKDEILVLKKGSIYHAIGRLESALLIEGVDTRRNGKRPERTTYRIKPAGEQELIACLRKQISVPQRERSEFMASISFLIHLKPEDAADGLEQRVGLLRKEIASMDSSLVMLRPRIGRINSIEVEYMRAMRAAELEWVLGLLSDLRSGRFTWDLEAILQELRKAVTQ